MSLLMLSLLNPKTCNFSEAIQTCQSAVNPTDIACALSYMNIEKPYYYYILARFCHDENACQNLWNHLTNKIQQDISGNKWQDEKNRAQKLALIVLYMTLYSKPCKHCGGSGQIHITHDENTPCKKCFGVGISPVSVREQKKITGISKNTWCRTWRPRIVHYLITFASIETEINARLKKQLHSH